MSDKKEVKVDTKHESCTVKLCPNCKPHTYQDRHYGPNMRVMNWRRKGGQSKNGAYSCTVCRKDDR